MSLQRLRKLWRIIENNTKVYNVVLTIVVVGVLFFAYARYTPFVFSTNDDLFMKGILSGEVTGEPEYRAIHLGILPGLIVSGLYRIMPEMPWYGLFLCVCQLGAMALVLYKCLKKTVEIRKKVVIVLAFSLVSSGIQIVHFAAVQYTVVAGIVGAAAIFWFFVTDYTIQVTDFLKSNIPTFLLLLLAYSIRDKVVFMLLPIAGMLWVAKLFAGGIVAVKERIKPYMGFFLVVILILGAARGLEYVSCADKEWQEFEKYNTSRESIYDYYGYPDYEDNLQTYKELGISYASYMGASTKYLVLLDDNINAESMSVLAELTRQESQERVVLLDKVKTLFREFITRNLNYDDRPLNLYVYFAYFLIFLCVFITRKYQVLLPVGALLMGRMVTWIYLFWQGRYPIRVTQALYFAELLALIAIMLEYQVFVIKKGSVLVMMMSLLVVLTVRFGWPEAKEQRETNHYKIDYSSAYEEWKLYSMSHSENFYLIDIHSVEYYTENILARQEYRDLNFVMLGGWLANSPLYDKKINDSEIENIEMALLENDNVYAVFAQTDGVSMEYLYHYYEEKYPGCSWKTVDTYETGNGTVFVIVKPVRIKG